MARGRHVIEAALDFARMPALARNAVWPPIPRDILEVMRIAAAAPDACREAASVTGETPDALIEAARFYLQQSLLRPDADAYRVLGLEPGAARVTAREHMGWLLQWLHPDHNGELEAVYAERVLKAWREVSASFGPGETHDPFADPARRRPARDTKFRLPWIKRPVKASGHRGQVVYVTAASWAIPGLVLVVLALWSVAYFFGFGSIAAVLSER
ncbi:MAG TPA: hypothetical protein VG986_11660 [Pseudolabrys sp.]|nr:hypothetical protein [Pseudolabrys sp.]